jgi:hypothetical protein
MEIRDDSVGIALGYGLDDRGSSPGRGWEFFSSPPCPDRLWGPLSLLSNGYQGVSFPGGEADHSSPSSVDVKNARNCTSTFEIRLRCVVLG